MFKRVTALTMALAGLVAVSCGGNADVPEADVAIVSNSVADGSDADGDSAPEPTRNDDQVDQDPGASTSEVVPAATPTAAAVPTPTVAPADNSAPEAPIEAAPAPAVVPVDPTAAFEEATGDTIVLASGDGRVTLDPGDPLDGWAELHVDRVVSVGQYDSLGSSAGHKLVVADVQLWGIDDGRVDTAMFRLETEDEVVPSLVRFNDRLDFGGVINTQVVFEVDESATVVNVIGGVSNDAVDGFQSGFKATLTPIDPAAPAPEVGYTDADIERSATAIRLTSPSSLMSLDLDSRSKGAAELTVHAARTTNRIDADGAGPDHKFLIIDYQLLIVDGNNLFEEAFRLEAGGELYPPLVNLNENRGDGGVLNSELVFRVPREIFEFELRGGVPASSDDGVRATYEIIIDLAVAPAAPEAVKQRTDEEITVDASSVTLISPSAVMSLDPGSPNGGTGTLTVVRARTAARIEADGAGPDNKFVIIDYRLEVPDRDNFFDEAFRLDAGGELYPQLVSINELPDGVINGTIVFRIPRAIDVVQLEGGVPPSFVDGSTTRFEIEF